MCEKSSKGNQRSKQYRCKKELCEHVVLDIRILITCSWCMCGVAPNKTMVKTAGTGVTVVRFVDAYCVVESRKA